MNRYSYVQNNPILFNDPTGHMETCGIDDLACGGGGGIGGGGGGGGSEVGRGNYCRTHHGACGDGIGDDDLKEELAGSQVKLGTSEGMSFLAVEATGFDVAAFLANLAFAVPADVIMLAYPPSIPVVEAAYQPYSVLPNVLSSVATVFWAMEGIRTGQTTISLNLESSGTGDFSTANIINGTKISFSLDQDTAVSVATNTAGWTVLREVNAAMIVDGGVVLYDVGRNSKVIPAVNPTVSYHTSSGGWDFSWFPK